MPGRTGTGENRSARPDADRSRAEFVVAAIWLVFYVLALGVVVTSSLAPGVIEFAAYDRGTAHHKGH
jgi:hypothetical protein